MPEVCIKGAVLQKEEELMASSTLAATSNLRIYELRPAIIDRIALVERDRALQKILRRLFSPGRI